jgi:hypothetical protein
MARNLAVLGYGDPQTWGGRVPFSESDFNNYETDQAREKLEASFQGDALVYMYDSGNTVKTDTALLAWARGEVVTLEQVTAMRTELKALYETALNRFIEKHLDDEIKRIREGNFNDYDYDA